eukprot:315392-Prorocentrum_minimum.AAC.2
MLAGMLGRYCIDLLAGSQYTDRTTATPDVNGGADAAVGNIPTQLDDAVRALGSEKSLTKLLAALHGKALKCMHALKNAERKLNDSANEELENIRDWIYATDREV